MISEIAVLCNDGDVRLNGSMAGLLEVCFNETWRIICNRQWNTSDAKVACRQLGLSMFGKEVLSHVLGSIYISNMLD